MPILRKVPTAQAAAWQPEREHIDADELLTRVVGSDRVGLTRMEYPESWGWMARVYGGGRTFVRFCADSAHGGPEQALRKAIAWRDAQRRQVESLKQPAKARRIIRIDRPEWKNVGYFAWSAAGQRRYFSDTRYGGSAGAEAAARAWAAA
jgi:hypothetical protein